MPTHDQRIAYDIVIRLFPHVLQDHHGSQREETVSSFFVSVVASGHDRVSEEI